MKSVLFLMRYPLIDAYNLKQKFDGQIQAAVNLGYNVYFIAYDRENVYLVNKNKDAKQKICRTRFGAFPKYRSTFGFFDLFKAFSKAQKNIHFDLVYMRSKIMLPTAISALKKHKKSGGKLMVEIPSYNSKEQELSRFRSCVQGVASIWKKKLPQLVDLYTLIGATDVKEYNGRPALCISNGVCVENFPAHTHKAGEEVRILALASMRNWQGYDRLIKGLSEYDGKTPVYIEMIGDDGDGSLILWRDLAKEKGVESHVNFRGALYDSQLTNAVNRCDIGAATLGLHRKSKGVGSVLKVREYMARGIPFIYSYDDSLLDGKEPFALKITGDDSAVSIAQVVDWVETLRMNKNITEEMRTFAKEKMSWDAQLKNAFDKVLG